MRTEPLLNEISRPGRSAYTVPVTGVPPETAVASLPARLIRQDDPDLPGVGEVDLCRHFTRLSQKNYALSSTFYPLGSCTMKYNPAVNEQIASLPGFAEIHPYQPESSIQGALMLQKELEEYLGGICGMDAFSLQPAAGAHGEFAGLLIARAYFRERGEKRDVIIVPDSAHGTNPASAALAGFRIVSLPSGADGCLDPVKLRSLLTTEVAAIMLTVPNTLGVFEPQILRIAEMVHANGSLLYYDGANLNAVMGTVRPGDLGFDIMHVNLHKSFSTPHGGGGPGAGPVGVKQFLEPYLPLPRIVKRGDALAFDHDRPRSIGRVRSFYGNFPVLVRAYAYIRALGGEGLSRAGRQAVINANYLLALLCDLFDVPAGQRCMHEFVLSARRYVPGGIRALDIAKRLLDYGYYAPTIYFPLIVEEAMMIEPTESESKHTLDEFAAVMRSIIAEAQNDPDKLKQAPVTTPVTRLNEVEAARKPILRW